MIGISLELQIIDNQLIKIFFLFFNTSSKMNFNYWEFLGAYHWELIASLEFFVLLFYIFGNKKPNKEDTKKKKHTIKILKFLVIQLEQIIKKLNELVNIWEEAPKY